MLFSFVIFVLSFLFCHFCFVIFVLSFLFCHFCFRFRGLFSRIFRIFRNFSHSKMVKTSKVWNFYKVIDGNNVCNECGIPIRTTGRSTSGLRSHLAHKHPLLRLELDRQENENVVAVSKDSSISSVEGGEHSRVTQPGSSGDPQPGPSGSQRPKPHHLKRVYDASADLIGSDNETTPPPRKSFKTSTPGRRPTKPEWLAKHPDNVRIVSQVTKMIVMADLPFMLVDHPEFIELLKLTTNGQYNPVGRKSLSSSKVPGLHHLVEQKCKSIIQKDVLKLDSLAFTTDTWTSRDNDPFQSLTLHYLDKRFVLKKFLVKLDSFTGKHTAETIGKKLENQILSLELGSKLNHICVSDGAANVRKALTDSNTIDVGMWCVDHQIHLIVTQALDSVASWIPLSIKLTDLTTYFNKSAKATHQLRKFAIEKGLTRTKLIKKCPTRWNSEKHQIESVLELFPALEQMVQQADTRVEGSLPTLAEKTDIEEVMVLLSAWEKFSIAVSQEKSPTLHLVIPTLTNLRHQMDRTAAGNPLTPAGEIAETLLHELDSRFNKCGTLVAEYCYAHMLDPRFKGCLLHPRVHGGFDMRRTELIDELIALIRTDNPSNDPSPEVTFVVPEYDLNDIVSQFFDDIRGTSQDAAQTKRTARELEATREIDLYLKETCIPRDSDILAYWNIQRDKFPYLCRLARKYLAIPASSSSSERIFSGAGRIVTVKRTSLSVGSVEMLVYLRENLKNLKDININVDLK
ncbi:MAG: hAT transposon family protein [Oligoflexia bacterium]|nr:hAT transposon family protein [Oligoflexia bacterium]